MSIEFYFKANFTPRNKCGLFRRVFLATGVAMVVEKDGWFRRRGPTWSAHAWRVMDFWLPGSDPRDSVPSTEIERLKKFVVVDVI